MFRAIMLKGKASEVFDTLRAMAKSHPLRTIGEIEENIKEHQRKYGLGGER